MSRSAEIDYLGSHGGELALAFASGCMACFVFCAAVGKLMWSMLGKAKDDEIASLKRQQGDCREENERLTNRIVMLEGFMFGMMPGTMRQDFQRALSEQHIEIDHLKGEEK